MVVCPAHAVRHSAALLADTRHALPLPANGACRVAHRRNFQATLMCGFRACAARSATCTLLYSTAQSRICDKPSFVA